MLVWGQTVLRDQLKDTGYLLYWAICFFFTFLAICTALLDLLLVRRQNRIDQRDLLKKAFTSRNPDEGELDDSSRRDHSR